MTSEVPSDVFTEQRPMIMDDSNDENPCEEEIRNVIDKALDDNIEDVDWDAEDVENIPPNFALKHAELNASKRLESQQQQQQQQQQQLILSQQQQQQQAMAANPQQTYNSHTNLKMSFQHSGGQWPIPQPPRPLHPFLKVGPYGLPPTSYAPPPGYFAPYPPPYPYPPTSYGYESGTYDSSETGTANNTEQQLSRDDYYPASADNKSDWNSYCDGGTNNCASPECEDESLPLNSNVFTEGDEQSPDKLNALYRVNQRNFALITRQLQETRETYNKELHHHQHKIGLLNTEKNLLESQISQMEVKQKQLEETVDREREGQDEKSKEVKRLEEKLLDMELQLQERDSEIDRMSYQLKDTVPRKESDYYEQMVIKVKTQSQQEICELKRGVDEGKREIATKNLEIETLKVELQRCVSDKITRVETDLRTKEEALKKATSDLLVTLPKLGYTNPSLPLVTEVEGGDILELTRHINTIVLELCNSEEPPQELSSRILDLTTEVQTLRKTATRLGMCVSDAEAAQKEAERLAQEKEKEVLRQDVEIQKNLRILSELRHTLETAEKRAVQAEQERRDAMNKLKAAETRCEQLDVQQAEMVKSSQNSKREYQAQVDEMRLEIKKLEQEVDLGKESFTKLSGNIQVEYEQCIREVRKQERQDVLSQCEQEMSRVIQMKDTTAAKEKKDLEERLVGEYEKKVEDAVKKAVENAKKTWSNCSIGTNVSTLCIFDMSEAAVQTDCSDIDHHFSKIWAKERVRELDLARETAVAIAKKQWIEETEHQIRAKVEEIVGSSKEKWLEIGKRYRTDEIKQLKEQLKESATYADNIKQIREQFVEKLRLKEMECEVLREKAKCEEELQKTASVKEEELREYQEKVVQLQCNLDKLREEKRLLKKENEERVEKQLKMNSDMDELQRLFEEVKVSEEKQRRKADKARTRADTIEKTAAVRDQEFADRERQLKAQCETVVEKMKDELIQYAENTNVQCMQFLQKSVAKCKDGTSQKYKKYYQKLLQCLIEKHPDIKNTVKHLQSTLPKQVPRTPRTRTNSSDSHRFTKQNDSPVMLQFRSSPAISETRSSPVKLKPDSTARSPRYVGTEATVGSEDSGLPPSQNTVQLSPRYYVFRDTSLLTADTSENTVNKHGNSSARRRLRLNFPSN